MNIKEIRNTTGLSQRSFSKMFNIPISTLQKWEQGESSPTPYIIKLIANQLPIDNDNMCKIEDNNGKIYYYNRDAGYLIDSIGTKILMVLRKKIFYYMWLIYLNPIMK